MPIPADRLKLVPYGTIDGGQDWSTSINCSVVLAGDAFDLDNLAAVTTDLELFFATWFSTIADRASSLTTYNGLKAYWYGLPGNVATLQEDKPTGAVLSGTGSVQLPTVTSLVVTTETGRSGRSYRGRSYWPLTASSLTGGGQLGSSSVDEIAGAYQALLNDLNAYSSVPGAIDSMRVVVASAIKSALTPVESIRVDSMPDVQHRRNDKIAAVYQKVLTVS